MSLSHTPEKKARVLELLKTMTQKQVAKQENVDASTIRRWVSEGKAKKPLTELREKYAPEEKNVIDVRNIDSVVLAVPDLHCPFEHRDALAFLCKVRDKFRPTKVVCLGDEIDAHAFSRYIPDPDGHSPGKELELAIEHLIPFYREFPEVLVCESNHTVRPWKKIFEAGLPAAFLPTYSKILNAPDGWIWKGKHVVDGVLYVHGDNGKSGAYAHQNYVREAKQSVVIGHMHANAGVQYDSQLFGMNTGCLIDKEAYAFKYAKSAIKGVNLGCGIVINGEIAYFIPMRLDAGGRWIGRL